MQKDIRDVLILVKKRYGSTVLSEPLKLVSILEDVAPWLKAEICAFTAISKKRKILEMTADTDAVREQLQKDLLKEVLQTDTENRRAIEYCVYLISCLMNEKTPGRDITYSYAQLPKDDKAKMMRRFALGFAAVVALVFSVVGLTSLILQGNPGKDGIPEDAVAYNGHYYYIYSEPLADYQDVVLFCNGRGGYPAVVTSEKENTFLYEYLCKSGYFYAFLGCTDAQEDGVWKWSNGEDFTFSKWSVGEPNNDLGGEEHVAIYQLLKDGRWNDITYTSPKVSYTTVSIEELSTADVIADDDTTSAWYGNAPGFGTDEVLEMRFRLTQRFVGFTIYVGDQKNTEGFNHTSRPARIRLNFDNEVSKVIDLKDILGPQTIMFDKAIASEKVTITVESVFEGTQADTIAISEISFMAEDIPTGFICEWGK